jgi:hypothetical protein
VFSTFQCIAWVKNSALQQDLSNRLCLAVVDRYGALVPAIWPGMRRFYGNPSKRLPKSLSQNDYMGAIEAMSKSFCDLQSK